ncbi:hypothetical protein EBU99_00840 [bacterium]|nr:hypothetical protein [bacterium]
MNRKINLAPSILVKNHRVQTGPSETFNQLRKALRDALPLGIILLLLILFSTGKASLTPMSLWSQNQFFQHLRVQSMHLPFPQQLAPLKDNFLTNERIRDHRLQTTFRTAGLTHLLALSGGQTSPAALAVCRFIFIIIASALSARRAIALSENNFLRSLAAFISLSIQLFLLGLYQATGALCRALSNHICHLLFWITLRSMQRENFSDAIIASRTLYCIPWILTWAMSQNPAEDLSFLLSAAGSLMARAVSLCWRYFSERHQLNANPKNPKCKIYSHIQSVFGWVIVTASTSALMCFCCWPLWPIDSITDKVFANLLAGPVVLLLITPFSLLLSFSLALQIDFLVQTASLGLQYGLKLFLCIASTFSHEDVLHSGFTARVPVTQTIINAESPILNLDWQNHPYLWLLLEIFILQVICCWVRLHLDAREPEKEREKFTHPEKTTLWLPLS